MNIINKYTLPLSLADAAATNNNNAATGFAAGGAYEAEISGFTAVGVATPIAVGNAVGVIPTTNATFTGSLETSKVYDVALNDAYALGGAQPHTYKIPLSILGIDTNNQAINSILILNTYVKSTGDLYPVTDRFYYHYSKAKKAIYLGWPDVDEAWYTGGDKGLKMQITLVSAKL